jgi:hypothetical protein
LGCNAWLYHFFRPLFKAAERGCCALIADETCFVALRASTLLAATDKSQYRGLQEIVAYRLSGIIRSIDRIRLPLEASVT